MDKVPDKDSAFDGDGQDWDSELEAARAASRAEMERVQRRREEAIAKLKEAAAVLRDPRIAALAQELGSGVRVPYVAGLDVDRGRDAGIPSTAPPPSIEKLEARLGRLQLHRKPEVMRNAEALAQQELPFEWMTEQERDEEIERWGGIKDVRGPLENLHRKLGLTRGDLSILFAEHEIGQEKIDESDKAPSEAGDYVDQTWAHLRAVRSVARDAHWLKAPADVLAAIDAWHARATTVVRSTRPKEYIAELTKEYEDTETRGDLVASGEVLLVIGGLRDRGWKEAAESDQKHLVARAENWLLSEGLEPADVATLKAAWLQPVSYDKDQETFRVEPGSHHLKYPTRTHRLEDDQPSPWAFREKELRKINTRIGRRSGKEAGRSR